MLDMLATMMTEIADHETLMPDMARCMAKVRDELISQGFTREEAIDILKHQGIGVSQS